MDFEEMKVIWDTQNEETLYAINQEALHASIRRKASGFKRLVLFFEIATMLVTLSMSLVYIVEVLVKRSEYHQLLSAAILLAAATRFFVGIRRRRQREAEFEPSLLGDLNKALWQVDYHIARARAFRWGFIFPFVLAVSIDVAFNLNTWFIWFWLVFLAWMAIATWGIEKEIRFFYLPKKRKLESLREMLAGSERKLEADSQSSSSDSAFE